MKNTIILAIKESIEIKNKILSNDNLIKEIEKVSEAIIKVIKDGGKVLVCGNGGSAGDAQHIAGEFINKFYYDRPAMGCIALTTDTSVITAIGNDSTFEDIFAKQVKANGRKGDIFWGISTSGNSKNIIKAILECKNIGIPCIAFVGGNENKMADLCDYVIKIPNNCTPRIQEAQMLIAHIICQVVEMNVYPKE